ncbi:MAG: ThuA domain-containing protein [Bryobacterales bacterium]|nr:ThuA domain-containing protein [Bryobacterales bacterium]
MIRCVLPFVLTLAALSPAAPAQMPVAQPKIQTLIITGQNNHDWRAVTPELRRILEDTNRFEVRVIEEFRGAGPETLAPYDLVILNYFEGRNRSLWWGDRANQALLDFVRNGKGLVMYHFSAAAFDGWPEYEKLSGGNWRPGQGHHSPSHDFIVKITGIHHVGRRTLPPRMNSPRGPAALLLVPLDDHSSAGP